MNKTKSISDMKIGSAGVFVGVKDSSATFLKYLNKKNLALGDRIRVIDIEPFDSSYHIETKTHRSRPIFQGNSIKPLRGYMVSFNIF